MIAVRKNSLKALADKKLQASLKKATMTALQKRSAAIAGSETYETSRDRAIAVRDASVSGLSLLLDQFSAACRKLSIKVDIFDDYEGANARILEIIKAKGADYIVKSKSMLTEEMALNDHLGKNGVVPIETDLGEFIVQLAGEAPSHITSPALHKSKQDVAALFTEKLDMASTDDIQAMAEFARNHMREKFLNAKVGITGANFAIAESGSIAIVENEGNARMCLSMPETHIAVFGVEKLIPRLRDLPYFLDLLSKSATGQISNAYTSVAGKPAAGHERHYIIVTHKRFEMAADPVFKEALRCIRCGACQNVCPVFQRISGHGYGFTYGGPIGIMLAPFFKGYTECEEMINASTLCGFCSSICPMKISIPHLIIEHRRRLAEEYDGRVSLAHGFKRLLSYAYRIAMSYYLVRKAVRPLTRMYLKLSRKALGYNYIPLWNKFAKRHFIDMPRKTFMEGHFKK